MACHLEQVQIHNVFQNLMFQFAGHKMPVMPSSGRAQGAIRDPCNGVDVAVATSDDAHWGTVATGAAGLLAPVFEDARF